MIDHTQEMAQKETELWSLQLTIEDLIDLWYAGTGIKPPRKPLQKISRFLNFEVAKNDNEAAKNRILSELKLALTKLKIRDKHRSVYCMAMPYLKTTGKPASLNGDRMIRIKDKYSDFRLLKIKNPDVALVQGYGSKALEQLEK